MSEYCEEYQHRRKVFLLKEQEKGQSSSKVQAETPEKKPEKSRVSPNMSMIDVLGIDSADER